MDNDVPREKTKLLLFALLLTNGVCAETLLLKKKHFE